MRFITWVLRVMFGLVLTCLSLPEMSQVWEQPKCQAIRRSGINARFYQASSSEMFGAAPPPQSETTPFRPRSPYGHETFFHAATCLA